MNREIVEEYNKSLYDIDSSNIWKYIIDDSINFGMVSSYGSNCTSEELHNEIKGLDLDFIKLSGGYEKIDKYGDTVKTKLNACSFMIADISMEQIVEIGRKYKQNIILLKDYAVLSHMLLDPIANQELGCFIGSDTKRHMYDNNIDFAKAIAKEYYDQLFITNKGFNYNQICNGQTFFLLEYRQMPFDPGLFAAMTGYKSGWFKRI